MDAKVKKFKNKIKGIPIIVIKCILHTFHEGEIMFLVKDYLHMKTRLVAYIV
jgi:hypothetical protein